MKSRIISDISAFLPCKVILTHFKEIVQINNGCAAHFFNEINILIIETTAAKNLHRREMRLLWR